MVMGETCDATGCTCQWEASGRSPGAGNGWPQVSSASQMEGVWQAGMSTAFRSRSRRAGGAVASCGAGRSAPQPPRCSCWRTADLRRRLAPPTLPPPSPAPRASGRAPPAACRPSAACRAARRPCLRECRMVHPCPAAALHTQDFEAKFFLQIGVCQPARKEEQQGGAESEVSADWAPGGRVGVHSSPMRLALHTALSLVC